MSPRPHIIKAILRLAVAASVFAASHANAGSWAQFQAQAPAAAPAQWQQILVGAGGLFSAPDVASDNTQIVRLDGPGAYIWNAMAKAQNGATGTWQPLVTTSSMPSALVSNPQGFQAGVFEIKMQYTHSNNMYMVYPYWTAADEDDAQCAVYKSTDTGAHWAQTTFTTDCVSYTPWNGNWRFFNNRMDIDPTSDNNVFLGTQGDGLWFTQDGGTTWTEISTSVVPVGSNEGIDGVLFDPQNHNIAYVCSGGHGVYKSTDATSDNPPTFTLTSSGPTGCSFTDIDQHNGNYYALDEARENLWVYNGSTWSKVLTSTYYGTQSIIGVTVDPTTANHVIAADPFGNLDESTNAGSSWGGWTNNQTGPAYEYTNDVTWLSVFGNQDGREGVFFDRSNPLIIDYTSENGFYTTTLPGAITNATNLTLYARARGVENLTTQHILSAPTAPAGVYLSAADHGVFSTTPASFNTYPTTFGPIPSIDQSNLCVAWDADYATSNPAFVGVECDGINYYPGQGASWLYSGYTSNGGGTWSNWNTGDYPTSASNGGQNLAFTTPADCLWAPSGSVLPSYSSGCNTTTPSWTQISLPGSPSLSGFLNQGTVPAKEIAADRVSSGYFYLLDPGVGMFYSQNGGSSWTAGDTITDIALTKTPIMKMTPGVAGDGYIAGGFNGSPGQQPGGGYLYHTIGGWHSSGVDCQITSMANPTSVGFGAPKSGNTYPSIFASGWVADSASGSLTIPGSLPSTGFQFTASTGSNYYPVGTALSLMAGGQGSGSQMNGIVTGYNSGTGVVTMTVYNTQGSGSHTSWGVYISGVWENDNFSSSTCDPASVAANWKLVGSTQYPLGSMQWVNDIDGDMNIYGAAYIALGVQGWAYYPYLLNRDLDPASNDNSPVGLAKVG